MTRMMKRAGVLGALALGLGCSGTPPGTGNVDMDGSQGDSKVLAGAFQVSLVAPVPASMTPGYTAVVGKVYDGPSPSLIIWTQTRQEGVCKLLKPSVPFCNTPCTGGAVCVAADKCQKYPSGQDVGAVKVSGLKTADGAMEFTMTAIAKNYQPPAGVSLPYPAFTEGAAIKFDAAGGPYAPFSLQTTGISPLTLQNGTIALAMNQAVALSWNAPTKAGAKVHVKLDISHHGGSKGMIECDADDSGALTLPAALITELLSLGAAGFPTIIVTRTSTGSAVIAPGRVDLVVSSEVEKEVVVPGVTSCNDSKDCPMGQTCQADLTCK